MTHLSSISRKSAAFTLIELVMVIVILGILTAFALPRFADLSRSSRIATLEGIEASIRSSIGIIKGLAYINGLSVTSINPGAGQIDYVVETEAGKFEVDYRNLCPESSGEEEDNLDMVDHIDFKPNSDLTVITGNRYTRIGYDIQGSGSPTANGCYITYDSFGDPECTVSLITTDC